MLITISNRSCAATKTEAVEPCQKTEDLAGSQRYKKAEKQSMETEIAKTKAVFKSQNTKAGGV